MNNYIFTGLQLNNNFRILYSIKSLSFFVLLLLLTFSSFDGYCQSNEEVLDWSTLSSQISNMPVSLTNEDPGDLNYAVKSGKLYIHLSLLNNKDFYQLHECEYNYQLGCEIVVDNHDPIDPFDLSVSRNEPEAMYVLDLTQQQLSGLNFRLSADGAFVGTPDCALSEITSRIKLTMSYKVDYGVDIRLSGSGALPWLYITSVEITDKQAKISWKPMQQGINFPNYQLQVLRLYNESGESEFLLDQQRIKTTLTEADWSKAFDILTESSNNFYEMTLAEGVGFYVCRVRPIGSYYEGGYANSNNWSDHQWSNVGYSADPLILNYNNLALPFFYYSEDPDELINWIYSRIFTEGTGHVSEQITYATGLNQVKQTQKYLPSSNKNIVIQNIYDYSGRAALSTLPVPVSEGLTGYKTSFVQTDNGELYQSKHFDDELNYLTPEKVSKSGEFSYYSTDNVNELQVPSAEGYPYSRTIFTNDGSGRVAEQAGVGYTHTLHDAVGNELTRRTVKSFYGKATEQELIRVFGAEAPKAESVFKTITIDQNNVVSITYTGKEGQVLATCLSKNNFEVQNGQLTDLDTESSTPTAMQDIITLNAKASDGYISTHHIFIDQDNAGVQLAYRYNCDQNEFDCGSVEIDCGFFLHIAIYSALDNNLVWESNYADKLVCGDEISFSVPGILPKGEYVVTKKLSYNPDDVKTLFIQNAENAINPILNWISVNIEAVNDDDDQREFYLNLIHFANTLNDCAPEVPSPPIAVCQNLINQGVSGNLMLSSAHQMQLLHYVGEVLDIVNEAYIESMDSFDEELFYIYLSSDCCDDFYIPCIFEGKYKCDGTHPPRFEQYLADVIGPGFIHDDYLPGYETGQFDAMINNMVTVPYDIHDGNGEMLQYDCTELWNTWVMVISGYTQFKNSGMHRDDYYVSGEVDNENNRNPQVHDNHFDENSNFRGLFGWALKWYTDMKLSKIARNGSTQASYKVNLAEDFLNYVGHKFVLPVIVDQSGHIINGPLSGDDYNSTRTFYTGSGATIAPHPYIKDRLFAYKYYQYVQGSHNACEVLNCYKLFQTSEPYCQEVPKCDSYWAEWDYEQNISFYNCLMNLDADPPVVGLKSCSDIDLVVVHKETKEKCYSNCQNNYFDYRRGIEDVFYQNCYDIDGCETDPNSISSAALDELAKYAVQVCQLQYCDELKETDVTCEDYRCRDIYTNQIYTDFPRLVIAACDLMNLQVSEWFLDIGVPNVCDGINDPSLCEQGNAALTVEQDCDDPTIDLLDIQHTDLKPVVIKVSNGNVIIE